MIRFKTYIVEDMQQYIQLKHVDLTKRGGDRLNVFLDKIKDGEEFLTKHGAVILDKSTLKGQEEVFKQKGFSGTFSAKLGARNIKVKYPNDFYKTPEFGGKGAGSGTAAEDRYLTQFRKEIEKTMERDQSGIIKIKIGTRIVNVSGIASTPGTPKSDFHLIDDKGNEVAWLSHKAGSRPKDFQQYGGLSHRTFSRNKDVGDFMGDLGDKYPEGLTSGKSAARLVKDKKVTQQSVWGVDYGGRPGRNNVDEFHQGPMHLKKIRKDLYRITSNHYAKNGEVPKDGYTAIYFARYTTDRGAKVGDKFVPKARVGVFPKDKKVGTTEEI